jgi:hypothetical protein
MCMLFLSCVFQNQRITACTSLSTVKTGSYTTKYGKMNSSLGIWQMKTGKQNTTCTQNKLKFGHMPNADRETQLF